MVIFNFGLYLIPLAKLQAPLPTNPVQLLKFNQFYLRLVSPVLAARFYFIFYSSWPLLRSERVSTEPWPETCTARAEKSSKVSEAIRACPRHPNHGKAHRRELVSREKSIWVLLELRWRFQWLDEVGSRLSLIFCWVCTGHRGRETTKIQFRD